MKRILLFLLSVSLLASCVQHSRDPIIKKELDIDLSETLAYIDGLSDEHRHNPDLYYQRAKVMYGSHDYKNAYADINKAIALKSSAMDYQLLKGKIEKQLNKPEHAIQSLLIAEKLGARDKKLYEILAAEYLQLGDIKRAKAAVDRLVNLQPDGSSYDLQGDVMLAIGDTAVAMTGYEKAIKNDRHIKNAYEQLANIYRKRKDITKAIHIIDQYLQVDPEDQEVLLQKGRLLNANQAYDSALVVYRDLISEDSTNYMVYYEISNLYYATNQYDSSAYMADKAYKMNEKFYDARMVVARSLDQQRKFQDAIDVYEQILQQDSTYNLASTELDNLKRKVAYLWQLEQRRKAKDSARNNAPPLIEKKKIEN